MKTITTILSLMVICLAVKAQAPDHSARCKEEMKKLTFLAGDWKGEANVRGPMGAQIITQQEHVEWKLQDMVLAIEGKGLRSAQGKEEVAFQAFAVVHFDPFEQQFKLKSFVKEGYSTNAYFKVLEPNKFEWGFDIPSGGKTKYTIVLNEEKKTWFETGEYSRDGNTWMKFIELNLTKI